MSQNSYWADEYSSAKIAQCNIGIGSDIYTQTLVHIQTGSLERFMCCLISLSKNSKIQKLSITEIFHALCLKTLISCPTVLLLKPVFFKLWHGLTESLLLKRHTWMMRDISIYLGNKVKICPMRNVSSSCMDPSLPQREQLRSLSELQSCSKYDQVKLYFCVLIFKEYPQFHWYNFLGGNIAFLGNSLSILAGQSLV